jgi:hypothetical protein
LAAAEFTPATGDVRESDPDVQAAVPAIARLVRRMTICLMVQLSGKRCAAKCGRPDLSDLVNAR